MGFDMDYTAELLKVCGIALLCSVCALILGKTSGSLVFCLRIGGGVLILGGLLVILKDNVEALLEMTSFLGSSQGTGVRAFSLMLKALGIAFISKICSDVCRDCGEGTLAGGIEGVGRIAIISLCIPIVAEILEYASAVLAAGS